MFQDDDDDDDEGDDVAMEICLLHLVDQSLTK